MNEHDSSRTEQKEPLKPPSLYRKGLAFFVFLLGVGYAASTVMGFVKETRKIDSVTLAIIVLAVAARLLIGLLVPPSDLYSLAPVVVGPAGEEIYTDQYGRVKVQFFWDREGNKDEESSCWIRVSQPWAGKNWGAIWIPRIGHEVRRYLARCRRT